MTQLVTNSLLRPFLPPEFPILPDDQLSQLTSDDGLVTEVSDGESWKTRIHLLSDQNGNLEGIIFSSFSPHVFIATHSPHNSAYTGKIKEVGVGINQVITSEALSRVNPFSTYISVISESSPTNPTPVVFTKQPPNLKN